MPKATMNPNDLASSREGNVRTSRNPPVLQSVPVSEVCKHAPQGLLGTRVPMPNAGHQLAALCFAENVGTHGRLRS